MNEASIWRVHSVVTPRIGRITVTGHLPASEPLPRKPMRVLDSYAMVYVLAGDGSYADANGFATTVTAGDMLLILPDVPHTYGPPPGRTWHQLFIVFEGSVFDLWRRDGLLDAEPPVRRLEPIDRWATAFHEIVNGARRDTPASVLQDVCRLQLLLADALAETQHTAQSAPDDERWLAQATALLETDTHRHTPLEEIAAQLSMSYDGFRKRFRRLSGVSPARYRSLRTIDQACELMITNQLSNREIAATLGFSSEFHFSHRFRQLTGRSPRQFRATIPNAPNPSIS